MRAPTTIGLILATFLAVFASAGDVEFGWYDLELDPGGGWRAMGLDDFNNHKKAFITKYNQIQGIKPIKVFKSGNCCVGIKGGDKLVISGTQYGYQFPAAVSGGIRCNPSTGYSEAVYQFYKAPKLSMSQTFSVKAACATKHNPAIFIKEPVDSTSVQFGLYDVQKQPSGGWTSMGAKDFEKYKSHFIAQHNSNKGIPTIGTFQSGNCCVAVKGGRMLTISGSKYSFQFPSDAQYNLLKCNPAGGYRGNYRFYAATKLLASQKFGEKAGCSHSHNPSVFMKVAQKAQVSFGLYDVEKVPAGGWTVMAAADFEKYKTHFVKQYNENNGIPAIRTFQSGNCCVAVKGGRNKLVVSGTSYGFQFPSDATSGVLKCNPAGGYRGNFRFYMTKVLAENQRYTEKQGCSTSHNPAVFIKITAGTKPTQKPMRFGLYDAEKHPGGAWQLMAAADFIKHKTQFVTFYNKNNGVPPVANFKSGNCCIGVKNGLKLVIAGTAYKFQFPAGQDGGIRCNPSAGYNEKFYHFYRLSKLSKDVQFSEKKACATSHNPAIYMLAAGAQTPSPTSRPTKPPTRAPIHCTVVAWSAWSACSRSCGKGFQKRTRNVLYAAKHGGRSCPSLKQDRSCTLEDCPVHCGVSAWSSWSRCSSDCGGGMSGRTRTIEQTPSMNGNKCPHLSMSQLCNVQSCPVHCRVSAWSSWGSCSSDCGGGMRTREREVVINADFGGDTCPAIEESQPCNTKPCPVHCKVSTFGLWGKCNAKCGGGSFSRSRTVLLSANFGGDPCPSLHQSKKCNLHRCPIHCKVGDFGDWHSCSKTCGGGLRRRTRLVLVDAQFSGSGCPPLAEFSKCNVKPCAADCLVEGWGAWGKCSKYVQHIIHYTHYARLRVQHIIHYTHYA
jgi:hypothetical protein